MDEDVDEDELQWHQDLKDREVTVVEGNGWLFQMENELPIKLCDAKQLSIPKRPINKMFTLVFIILGAIFIKINIILGGIILMSLYLVHGYFFSHFL